jgi:hypothetical protein
MVTINGREVRKHGDAWFYYGSGTTPGAEGARQYGAYWFHGGSGVAVG